MAGRTAGWNSHTDSRYSTDNDHGASRTPSPASSTSWKEPYGMPDPKRRGRLLGQLINMEVPVSVRLCEKRMPLEDILASTKDYAHRLYRADGIWEEITLVFRHGKFETLPWTYPDFRAPTYHQFFAALRTELMGRISHRHRREVP